MECKVCEYSCGCIETCKLKSSECYQNKRERAEKGKAMTTNEAMGTIMQVACYGGFSLNSNEAFGIACKCIEKQIPKEIRQEVVNGKMARWCPNGCDITNVTMWATLNYCPYCGQKIGRGR